MSRAGSVFMVSGNSKTEPISLAQGRRLVAIVELHLDCESIDVFLSPLKHLMNIVKTNRLFVGVLKYAGTTLVHVASRPSTGN